MATLTNEERLQIIMSALDDNDDTTTLSLTGDGGVRDFAACMTAKQTGEYDEAQINTDWTNEEQATWALLTIRPLLENVWRRYRYLLEVDKNTAKTDAASRDLGTPETEPS